MYSQVQQQSRPSSPVNKQTPKETVFEIFKSDGSYSSSTSYERRLQKAFNLGGWQSVDYEEIDNEYQSKYHKQVLTDHQANKSKRRWFSTEFNKVFAQLIVAAVIGILAGLYYIGMYSITKYWFKLRVKWIEPYIGNPFVLFLTLLGPSMGMAFIAFFLTIWEPTAAGSGMPEVVAYLNGIERSRFLSWRTLLTKALGTICVVNSGLFQGYDGPLIHICALFALVVTRNVKKVPFLAKFLHGEINSKLDRNRSLISAARNHNMRLFATIGAAAGVAAAFQSPLAGVTFAIEEAMSFYDPRLIAKTLFACAMAIVGSNLAQLSKKSNGSDYSTYEVNVQCDINLWYLDYVAYLILGIIGGLAGHAFNVLVAKVRIFRQHHIQTNFWKRLIEVIFVIIITNVVIVFLLYGPNFSQANELAAKGQLACTQFDDAMRHINVVPKGQVCHMHCKEWIASNFNSRPCEKYISNSLCVVDAVKFSLENYISGSAAAANNTCREGSPDTPIYLLPNENDLGAILNQNANIKLPSYLYNSLTLDSKRKDKLKGTPVSAPDKPPVCYYQTASLVLNQPSGVLSNLFLRGYYFLFDSSVLTLFLIFYIIMSLLSHHLTMPTDLVLPTLVIGSVMGRLFGQGFNSILLNTGWQGQLVDPGATALLGLCAFWSGTSRLIITIIVIAIQNTGELTYINGVTLIVITASFVGNQFGPSQFHMELEAEEVPFLPHHAPYEFKSVTIKETLNHLHQKHGKINQVWDIPLSNEFTVAEASDLLRDEPRNEKNPNHRPPPFGYSGFPVVNHLGQLQGLLLRSQLERIVAMHAPNAYISPSLHTGSVFLGRPNALSSFETKWRRGQFHTHANLPVYIKGRSENLERCLKNEVAAQMNRSPMTVKPEYSLEKAYNIFRHLGLRHMMVVTESNDVIAILTRRDFSQIMEDIHHGHGPHSQNDEDQGSFSRSDFKPTPSQNNNFPRTSPTNAPQVRPDPRMYSSKRRSAFRRRRLTLATTFNQDSPALPPVRAYSRGSSPVHSPTHLRHQMFPPPRRPNVSSSDHDLEYDSRVTAQQYNSDRSFDNDISGLGSVKMDYSMFPPRGF